MTNTDSCPHCEGSWRDLERHADKLQDVVDLAIKMREEQRRYFKHRDNLPAAKAAERAFDEAVKSLTEGRLI